MKLKNIEQLRNFLLESIEKTFNNKMSIEELSIISKSAEAIFTSVKTQLIYSSMKQEEPNIDFLQSCNGGKKLPESAKVKKLSIL